MLETPWTWAIVCSTVCFLHYNGRENYCNPGLENVSAKNPTKWHRAFHKRSGPHEQTKRTKPTISFFLRQVYAALFITLLLKSSPYEGLSSVETKQGW